MATDEGGPFEDESYVLEVLSFRGAQRPFYMTGPIYHPFEEQTPTRAGKYTHVGYMDKIFPTKHAAAAYYDEHNPCMRRLNAHDTWISDWDPYVPGGYAFTVREARRIQATVPPFAKDHAARQTAAFVAQQEAEKKEDAKRPTPGLTRVPWVIDKATKRPRLSSN